jgi:hypothetical protein
MVGAMDFGLFPLVHWAPQNSALFSFPNGSNFGRGVKEIHVISVARKLGANPRRT